MAATAPSKQSGQIGTSDKSRARDKVAAHLIWWDTSLLLNEFLKCPAVLYRIAVPLNDHTSRPSGIKGFFYSGMVGCNSWTEWST